MLCSFFMNDNKHLKFIFINHNIEYLLLLNRINFFLLQYVCVFLYSWTFTLLTHLTYGLKYTGLKVSPFIGDFFIWYM